MGQPHRPQSISCLSWTYHALAGGVVGLKYHLLIIYEKGHI